MGPEVRYVEVVGRPVPKARPRLGRRRKAYTPQTTLDFEAKIREAWLAKYGDDPYDGTVGVEIHVYRNTTIVYVWQVDLHGAPALRGDLDNYSKSVFDGLIGAAFADDRNVVELHAYGESK